jgi:xylulokinase
VADGADYARMNELAADVEVGCEGLTLLPFGNGAERILGNRNPGASLHGLNFNVHGRGHLLRAAQEGIAFALNYGIQILHEVNVSTATVRAGYANMFLSPLFSEAFATVTGSILELYNTDGSQGAARGAGIGAGIYKNRESAFIGLKPVAKIVPDEALTDRYEEAYARWEHYLKQS